MERTGISHFLRLYELGSRCSKIVGGPKRMTDSLHKTPAPADVAARPLCTF